jgi:class 3 adenylate cyclase
VPRQARRFVATVLFTDVVGSTEVAASVGDEHWHAILRTYYDVARREVRRYRGREIDTAGDGFFAAFDAPTDGVHCAMAIVDAMWARGVALRAGLHTGECELVDGKVGGIAVHIGARVAGLAGAGEVLVTGTVHDLATGARLTFDSRGPQELRGVPGEWNVFGVEPEAGRPDLPPLEAPPPAAPPRSGRSRAGVLAGVGAGVVLVAVLVAVLVTRHRGGPSGEPTTPASHRATTPAPPPELFAGTLSLDPKTGKIVGRVPMPLSPNSTAGSHQMAAGPRFLWTADFAGNTVHKVDPRAPGEVGQVTVRAPEWLAVQGNDLFVTSGYPGSCTPCQLVRVDDRTNAIASSRAMAVCCGGMVIDHGFLWVLGVDRLFRVPLRGGRTTSIHLGGDAIAAGGGRVFVLSRTDGTATPVDEASFRAGTSIQLPGRGLGFVAYAEDALWVSDTSGDAVIHVPLSGRGGVDTIPVGDAPTAVSAGAGSVWVANREGHTVSRIDPIAAKVVKTYPAGGQPDDVLVAFGRVWVADAPPG